MGKSIKERDKTHRKPRNNKSNNLIQKYNTIGEQSATVMMAKTEVDYNGNIKNIILPYDSNRIMNQIKNQINLELLNNREYSLLKYIVDNSNDWVGSHVHNIEDWVTENLQPLDIWTGGDGLVPQFEWPLCTAEGCNFAGVGYCGSFCIGGKCKYTTVIEGEWIGENYHEGVKDLYYEMSVSIFFK